MSATDLGRPRERGRAALRATAGPTLAVGLSLAIGAVIVFASGGDPVAAYIALFDGAFGSARAIGRTLQNATPLILTGLAVAVAFRGGLFNIGGEGQFYVGGVTGAWLGVSLGLPLGLGIAVSIVGGAVAGALLAAIAGVLKARTGAHEVITTIMLNFIGINLANWLLLHPLSAGRTFPGSEDVRQANVLTPLSEATGNAHLGLLIALAAAALVYVVLWRTPLGYEIRVVGFAARAAEHAGIPIASRIILTMAIGGAFAGVAGAVEVLGTHGRMTVPFVVNVGFTGIGVALLGRNHPVGCVVGGLVFGALAAGGQAMQFATGIPLNLVIIVTALVLLFATAERLLPAVRGRRQPAGVRSETYEETA